MSNREIIYDESVKLEKAMLELVNLVQNSNLSHDPRWLAIYKTHIEEGMMAFRKSIFSKQKD